MEYTIWNVELLRTNQNKYTIYFLSIEGSFQKVIGEKNQLYEICKKLHDSEKTFWEIKTQARTIPSVISDEEMLKEMLINKQEC